MKIPIIDIDGNKAGDIELADAVFDAPLRRTLLWELVRAQRAGWRRGTASTKGRSEIRGSTKKIYRQKGTGRARHGSGHAPIFVGGGQQFGPRPRSYDITPPKKVRRQALRVAVSLRAREGNLLIVKEIKLPAIKTKTAVERLKKIGAESSLIVETKNNKFLARSVRNLQDVKCLAPEGLNVYDILLYPRLVMTPETARAIEKRLS